MLEIMTLICRITLPPTQTLTGPGSKGINILVIWAKLWSLNPKIATNWPQQRANSAGWWGYQPESSPQTCSAVPAHPARAGWRMWWGTLACAPSNPSLGIFHANVEQLFNTHGKTNTLLAWISIQGRNFFTRNSEALRTETLAKSFPLLLIYLLFTHANKNPILSLLYSTGCRQDGKEVTVTAPNWFMYLAKSDYRHQTGDLK